MESGASAMQGWRFVAGLGDNHASAVGCGMNADYRTMVVSGGTSGTINLSCPANAALPQTGKSLRFEFYEDSLLLLSMLGDCGAWYKRFLSHFAAGYAHDLDYLNMRALLSDLASLGVSCTATPGTPKRFRRLGRKPPWGRKPPGPSFQSCSNCCCA